MKNTCKLNMSFCRWCDQTHHRNRFDINRNSSSFMHVCDFYFYQSLHHDVKCNLVQIFHRVKAKTTTEPNSSVKEPGFIKTFLMIDLSKLSYLDENTKSRKQNQNSVIHNARSPSYEPHSNIM